MKQTISIINPPQTVQKQQQQQHMQKTPQKIEWVSTGLSSRSPTPPPPTHTHTTPPPTLPSPPRLPFFCFAMQHLKHLNCISLASRWLLDIVCWLG